MQQVKAKIKLAEWQFLTNRIGCHLFPDLYLPAVVREPGWRGALKIRRIRIY